MSRLRKLFLSSPHPIHDCRRFRRVMQAVLAVMLALAPATALAAILFNWSGQAEDNNNRTDPANWGNLTDYPGAGGRTNDTVVIDDPTPRATMVQNSADLTVVSLFVGDGHTIQLNHNLFVDRDVADPAADTGELQFEGVVHLNTNDDRYIDADYILIYSVNQDTEVTFDDGTGYDEGYVTTTYD